MDKVLIVVNADARITGQMSQLSPVTERMVTALKNAIPNTFAVDVIGSASLWSKAEALKIGKNSVIWCPLTIQLPHWIEFPAKTVYQACRAIEERRTWVSQTLHYQTHQGDFSFGDLWLPIVVTEKGLSYGEVIGEGMIPNAYEQPIDLDAKSRRSLHTLASRLLENLAAPPSVYLLQFRHLDREIIFDRLWPFPAAPALVSWQSHANDLYNFYWKCVSPKRLLDLPITTRK